MTVAELARVRAGLNSGEFSYAIAGGGTRTLTGLSPHRIFLLRWLSPPLRFVAWTFSWPWMSALGLSRKVSTPSSSCLFDRGGGQDISALQEEAWLGIATTRRC